MKQVTELLEKDSTLLKNGQLNQSLAARTFGIGQPTLNRWLMGTSGVSFELKMKILIHYGERPQDYLTGKEMDYLHTLKRYLDKYIN
jgi:hypothetical protein